MYTGLSTLSISASAFSLRVLFIESGTLGFVCLGEMGIQVFLLAMSFKYLM